MHIYNIKYIYIYIYTYTYIFTTIMGAASPENQFRTVEDLFCT